MPRVTIALLGNIANNFSREALLVNSMGRVEATCYYAKIPNGANTENPFSDPQQGKSTSALVPCKPMLGIPWYLLFLPRFLLYRVPSIDSVALAGINSKTLRVLSGPEIMLGPKLSRPYAIRPTGSDLTVYPSLNYREYWSIVGMGAKSKLSNWITWGLQTALYKRSYRHAASVAVQPETPFLSALSRIGLTQRSVSNGIPLAIDTELFCKVSEKSRLLPATVGESDFVVFMPSRIMIEREPAHVKTGQWKASEAGIHGFNNFVKNLAESDRRKVWLVIPDRLLSNDLAQAKRLITELHLSDRVIWVRGQEHQGLSRMEMIPLYSSAAATFDDFGVGWFGSVVVEAMACQSPVITFVADEVMTKNENPPLLLARTPEEICSRLTQLFASPLQRQQIGMESREWVRRRHSGDAVSNAYEQLLMDVTAPSRGYGFRAGA
jgi:glycosyltransferase involved in cell wall biosynthesis